MEFEADADVEDADGERAAPNLHPYTTGPTGAAGGGDGPRAASESLIV